MEAKKEALLASMLERKLNALHADYEATIAAETRKTETPDTEDMQAASDDYRQVSEVASAQEDGDDWADAEFQSGRGYEADTADRNVPLHPLPETADSSLDAAKIEYIKTVMSSIKLKAPSWLANVPEDVWMSNVSASVTANHSPASIEPQVAKTTGVKLLHTEYVTINTKDAAMSKKAVPKKRRTKAKRANYDATNPNIAGQEDDESFFTQAKQPVSVSAAVERKKQDEKLETDSKDSDVLSKKVSSTPNTDSTQLPGADVTQSITQEEPPVVGVHIQTESSLNT